MNPSSNMIVLYSNEFRSYIAAPLLNEDDIFQSAPRLGHITYRLPSLHDLFGIHDDFLQEYDSMTFYLHVQDQTGNTLKCVDDNNCKIVFYKTYTPRMHYLSPPVVYLDSFTQLWFDPKYAAGLQTDLKENEMAFVSARIGPSVMDFENTVTSEDTFTGYNGFASESVIGKVGELPVGQSHDITLLWEVGKSYTGHDSMTHCTYDN